MAFLGKYKTIKWIAFVYGISLFLFLLVNQAQAQTSITGIVNTYYPVSAISGTTITVGTSTGAAHTLAAGDWVMLIQMTGDPAIRAGSNMGKYEVVQVSSVAGSNVTLSALTRTYTTSEKVQLVWIPYSDTGFNVTGTVTPLAWNGTTGGIVALKGSTLTLTSNIDATAMGFNNTNTPGGTVLSTTPLGAGSTTGRGIEGGYSVVTTSAGGVFTTGGSPGGGGVGGGGVGSAFGNGGNPGQGGFISATGTPAPGVNGGTAQVQTATGGAIIGAGGGGGIIGGGGGGGGNTKQTAGQYFAGGGGGVSGGGASRKDDFISSTGGGSGGVGNGADGYGGGNSTLGPANGTEGSAGGGGGSYGGGGGASNNNSGGDDAYGGGGGGSYTGGGIGGLGGTYAIGGITQRYADGGTGNVAVTPIPDAAHYLKSSDARLMMGGAGGRGSGFGFFPTYVSGGKGGGIVFLDFDSMSGPGDVISNGGAGANAPTGYARSGGGGGGGGQMALKVGTFTSMVDISATGGVGGNPAAGTVHGGNSGAGGGGGGVWIQTKEATSRTVGATESLANVTVNLSGGNAGAQIINPKNGVLTATGGAGGAGLIVVDTVPCVLPTFTLTQTAPTCSSNTNQNNGKITLTAASNTTKYGISTGATYTGAAYASATAIGTLPIDVQTAIPNTGGTYTIRLFNGTDACSTDQTVTIQPVSCCSNPNCGTITVTKN